MLRKVRCSQWPVGHAWNANAMATAAGIATARSFHSDIGSSGPSSGIPPWYARAIAHDAAIVEVRTAAIRDSRALIGVAACRARELSFSLVTCRRRTHVSEPRADRRQAAAS